MPEYPRACECQWQIDAVQRHPVNLCLPARPVPVGHGVAAHTSRESPYIKPKNTWTIWTNLLKIVI